MIDMSLKSLIPAYLSFKDLKIFRKWFKLFEEKARSFDEVVKELLFLFIHENKNYKDTPIWS